MGGASTGLGSTGFGSHRTKFGPEKNGHNRTINYRAT